MPAADRFYTIVLNPGMKQYKGAMTCALNSTLTHLMTELNGRVNLGAGALDNMTYEAAQVQLVDPALLRETVELPIITREIESCFSEVGKKDRRELDDIVFDALKLTRGERDAVYEAVIDLVEARLKKADSLNRKASADDDED